MLSRQLTRGRRSRATGFTYLWLLFAVAAAGAVAAAIGQRASVTAQREKEAELAFRGHAIEHAIGSYWDANTELPRSLADLVEDRRGGALHRHLRRIWTDPFTGRDDWALVMAEDGVHLRGVHSTADVTAFDIKDLPQPAPGARRLVSQRLFVFSPAVSHPAAAAATPSSSAPASASRG
jgi:type II secretory pathway pseudopilin PulG